MLDTLTYLAFIEAIELAKLSLTQADENAIVEVIGE